MDAEVEIPWWRRWLPALVLGVFVFAVHARALEVGFVWDDVHVVIDYTWKDAGPWTWLTRPFTPFGYYRPLLSLTFLIDGLLFGTDPLGYHLTNLVLHLVNAGLVLALARRSGAGPWAAASAAGVWAVLPRLTEAVTWVVGRGDLLMAGLVLGALLVWPMSGNEPATGGWRRVLGASVLLLLGLGAKETAVAGVLAIVVHEILSGRRALAWVVRLAPLAVGLVIYTALRHSASQGMPATIALASASQRAFVVLEGIGTYVVMMVDPFRPASIIGSPGAVFWPFVGVGVLALLLGGISAWRFRAALTPERTVLLVAAVGALGVTLPVFPTWVNVVAADRFLYLPLALVAVVIAEPCARLPVRPRLAVIAVAGGLALGGAVFTQVRIGDYVEPARLWAKAIAATRGRSVVAIANFATQHDRAQDFAAAAELGTRAVQLRAQGVDPFVDPLHLHRQLARALSRAGRHGEALELQSHLVQAEPSAEEHRLALVRTLVFLGRSVAARRALQELSIAPERAREVREALAQLEARGLTWKPDASLSRLQEQRELLDRLDWYDATVRTWLLILQHREASPELVGQAAAVLLQIGPLAAAEVGVATFTARFPQHPDASVLSLALESRHAQAEVLARERARCQAWLR